MKQDIIRTLPIKEMYMDAERLRTCPHCRHLMFTYRGLCAFCKKESSGHIYVSSKVKASTMAGLSCLDHRRLI